MRFQDAFRDTEKNQLSKDLETRYITAQKEQKIQLHEEQLVRQKSEMNKGLLQRNALIGGVILLFVLGVLVY